MLEHDEGTHKIFVACEEATKNVGLQIQGEVRQNVSDIFQTTTTIRSFPLPKESIFIEHSLHIAFIDHRLCTMISIQIYWSF